MSAESPAQSIESVVVYRCLLGKAFKRKRSVVECFEGDVDSIIVS